ncbi:unnamed protein product [Tuber aestivum]|uniref:Uncharacterized protein n=1 Tax=Tuber aestivum TaxID=59557 RepID=A0A292PK59_9PEZI|nr:unnamed protein product [Tuber aestivum]
MNGCKSSTQFSEYIRALNCAIESNPEKPKHLENVTTKVIELDIDFFSLGSEGYSEESRIQQMVFGIQEKYALRRDCIINALLYVYTRN